MHIRGRLYALLAVSSAVTVALLWALLDEPPKRVVEAQRNTPPHSLRRLSPTPHLPHLAGPVEVGAQAKPKAKGDNAPVRATLASFADTRSSLAERLALTRRLARRADKSSITLLMRLGDAPLYLSWAGIRALGTVPNHDYRGTIGAYLRQKLRDSDSRNAEAAVWALGNMLGDEAVPSLAALLREERADGHSRLVNAEIVSTLGAINSSGSRTVLISALGRAGRLLAAQRWDYEYGSKVVAALRRFNTAESSQACAVYAAQLEAHLPSTPLARSYVFGKIAEARAALAMR